MVAVNWENLTEALAWYEDAGFKRINLPWHASDAAMEATFHEQRAIFDLKGVGRLVASAEQSFVDAHMNGTLGDGNWVALTPCFRDEPVLDELHLPYFMKVELFVPNSPVNYDLYLAMEAKAFMESLSAPDLDLIKTDIGYDLELNGIEVGSYCTREHEGYRWTCGTGLAEPRFSHAMSK